MKLVFKKFVLCLKSINVLQEDMVRQVLDEMKSLFEQNQADVYVLNVFVKIVVLVQQLLFASVIQPLVEMRIFILRFN